MVLVWFLFVNGHTPQKIYLEGAYQAFNFIWTFLPIIIYAFIDLDVPNQTARELPQLYHLGVRRHYFGLSTVLRWAASAFVESFVLFYLLIASLDAPAHTHGGQVRGAFANTTRFRHGQWYHLALTVRSGAATQ